MAPPDTPAGCFDLDVRGLSWRMLKHVTLTTKAVGSDAPMNSGPDLAMNSSAREPDPLRQLASWYTPGMSDGFGDRLLMFDNTAASSLRIYFEGRQVPFALAEGERIEAPTAILFTKKAFVKAPREWIERVYNLRQLSDAPGGAHLLAWEQPEALVDDVRTFFRTLR